MYIKLSVLIVRLTNGRGYSTRLRLIIIIIIFISGYQKGHKSPLNWPP